jgi:hypothetical protein
MSVEKAEQAIKEIRMKDGDLDGYIAKFEQLARIAGHDLNAKGTWTMFAEGLPKMLHYNMISQGGSAQTLGKNGPKVRSNNNKSGFIFRHFSMARYLR